MLPEVLAASAPGTSQPDQPLLTIAIPTFNRAASLAECLRALEPQLIAFPQVELFISDNGSPDDTPAVIAAATARLAAAGATLRSQRHPTNVGADANFASCYTAARGHYFWACGDDDILTPGTLALVLPHLQPDAVDLLYVTSYGFHDDFIAERQPDRFDRRFHTIRSSTDRNAGRTFARIVNIMFTFISGIIVNKSRLESVPHEDPARFIGTNLVQLSWGLPLLCSLRSAVVVWQRPVASRLGHAHGYSLGKVFGGNLKSNVERLLPNRPDLAAPILNRTLRRWFPSMLVAFRTAGNDSLQLDQVHTELTRAFGSNPRYWLFVYPALTLPLPLALLFTKVLALFNHALHIASFPTFWRKQT